MKIYRSKLILFTLSLVLGLYLLRSLTVFMEGPGQQGPF